MNAAISAALEDREDVMKSGGRARLDASEDGVFLHIGLFKIIMCVQYTLWPNGEPKRVSSLRKRERWDTL